MRETPLRENFDGRRRVGLAGKGMGRRGRNSKSRASARCSPLNIFVLFSICKIYICGRFFFKPRTKIIFIFKKVFIRKKKWKLKIVIIIIRRDKKFKRYKV